MFAIIPGHGHFFPYIPLANALTEAGHEVCFATSASYGETIKQYGFETVSVGIDYTQGSVEFDDADTMPVERLMFVDGPPVMLSDLVGLLPNLGTDVVLVDPTEMGSMVAAEASGVPYGAVVPGRRNGFIPGLVPFAPEDRRGSFDHKLREVWREMRESVDLESFDLLPGEFGYDRHFSLCMAPESFNGWPLRSQHHTSHPLRPEIHASESDDSWLEEVDGPLVAISFGTLFGTPELYSDAAKSALNTGANVVVSTSYDVDVEHENLIKVNWVSMDRLMERADVFVHHAGWGSTVASLASGTPSVTVPIGADQFVNTQAFLNTGAGITVARDQVAERLGDSVSKVLEADLYRLNAQRLKDEIDHMPSAGECVPLVEQLAEDGVVFNKPEV